MCVHEVVRCALLSSHFGRLTVLISVSLKGVQVTGKRAAGKAVKFQSYGPT